MKVGENRVFINLVIILILLILSIFCSDSKKTEKKNRNIYAEITEYTKIKNDNISKTTCSDCHKLDTKGNLIVSKKNLEGSKPPSTGGPTIH
jgi:nitrate/TMAO reductase-like tetraheme cytochrome c subunit